LVDWGDRILAQAAAPDQAIDPEARLYYLVIRWELRILAEFDRLVRGIDSAEVQRRYHAGRDLFTEETAWLQGELASLEQRADIAGDRTAAFHAAVDAFVEQLAVEWNQEVQRLSQQPWFHIE
jgi:hypothetical protein